MRLATWRDGTRDGALLVVGRDGRSFARASAIAPSLQAALDDWPRAAPALAALATQLDAKGGGEPLDEGRLDEGRLDEGRLDEGRLDEGRLDEGRLDEGRLDEGRLDEGRLDEGRLGPPLPRAYEWIDGSAFLNHVILARRARGAPPPATLETEPLVYQGGSGVLAGPRDELQFADPRLGLDFEAEVAVILGDVPRGTPAGQADQHVRLVLLANDVTLRNLVPDELAKGFGFFQSKPATAFSPFAVTPDELGDAWRDGRVHLPLRSTLTRAGSGKTLVGDPEAGPEMHFSFFDLVAHAARTRALGAGTILGSGTVSNRDRARGVSCLAELRALELIERGVATTPFMGAGDRIVIEMRDRSGRDLFGRIDQRVAA